MRSYILLCFCGYAGYIHACTSPFTQPRIVALGQKLSSAYSCQPLTVISQDAEKSHLLVLLKLTAPEVRLRPGSCCSMIWTHVTLSRCPLKTCVLTPVDKSQERIVPSELPDTKLTPFSTNELTPPLCPSMVNTGNAGRPFADDPAFRRSQSLILPSALPVTKHET